MIFKKFFKPLTQPKWQHKDFQVRVKALKEMSLEEEKHKTIINDLAFNDPSEKVRRLALERLNDFSLWWQASNDEKNERLKKLADDHLRKGLMGTADFVVEDTLKEKFIEQCKKPALLEELALNDKNDQTRLKLLSRLNKNALFMSSLQDNKTSGWLKTEILSKFNELPLLEKLVKKAEGSLKILLDDKIGGIKAAIEKPIQLKKEVGLMLAKLNALKDKMDIEEIERRQAHLALEWETLKTSFELLAELEANEFAAKYDKISKSLNTIVAPLKLKWQKQQAIDSDLAEKAANKAAIAERLTTIEAQLTKAISEHDELGVEDHSAPLKQIQQDMSQLNLDARDKSAFIKKIEQYHQKIDQIPLITECMAEALRLTAMLSSLPLPATTDELKEVYPTYKTWQQQWRDNQAKIGLAFPESINKAYDELNTQWQGAIGPLLKEQEQQFNQVRKSLSDLKYLLSSGKYRRAFGLFKKASYLVEQLNEWQLSKVSRDFDTVKAKVEELADWQEYIATPRKRQLLEDMVELAEHPVESPEEQAQKVKFTRQMWNSLGQAAQESESTLNQQFNTACEKAFEVCRNYYAEKETVRATNLKAKEAICDKLKDTQALLKGEDTPWQEIESVVSRVRKDWKSSGDIDRNKVSEINQQYFSLLDPLQKALRSFHDENATLKERLLKTAESLLEEADIFGAANQLKDIQQKWKTIGFAGSKADNLFWRKFRQVNDQVFAKRDDVKNQRDEQNKLRQDEFSQQLSQIEDAVLNTAELSVLSKNLSDLQAITSSLGDDPKPVQTRVTAAAAKLESLINTRKKELKLEADRDKYVTLFNQFVQVSKTGDVDPEIESAPAWNAVLMAMPQTSDSSLRYDLTIQLEIVNGVESPVRDTDRRMELQMALLSNKMNEGEMAQQVDLLKAWISVGRLDEEDVELLDRVKALYL